MRCAPVGALSRIETTSANGGFARGTGHSRDRPPRCSHCLACLSTTERGVVPNREGRVLDAADSPRYGTYAAGWIKRGPSGVIGTNKKCAAETVDRLLEDARAGLPDQPERDRRSLDELVQRHRSHRVDLRGWAAIDHHERTAGADTGRPRVKITTIHARTIAQETTDSPHDRICSPHS